MPLDTTSAVIEMQAISKRFGPVRALENASLTIRSGTIHGLVGANGAGKSTIIKVLAGILRPDTGTVRIGGKEVARLTPAVVENLGIHFIHQDRLLVPTATVAEAIFLRHEPRIGPFLNHKAMRRRAADLLKRYFDLDLPGDALIQDLTTAQQKIVQITRALAQEARVLVLDEPTAALVKREVDSLFRVLRRLRDDGIAVIFISHYMQEIEEICDEVTVMRNGTDVGVIDPRVAGIEQIVAMMINRDMGEMYPARHATIGAPVLEVQNLSLPGSFRNVSLTVRAGEVVGLTGLLGSGVKELVQCLFGLDRPGSGRIAIDGQDVSVGSPVQAVGQRIAMLPEDRRAHGIAASLSIADNISLASMGRYAKGGLVSSRKEAEIVEGLIRELSIKTPHRHNLVRNLSGGNQQKVAIAKWLSCQSRIYVLDEPTVAVDVGAKVEIYNLMNRLAQEGAAILLMSSELEELVGMCDRTLVIYRGELIDEFTRAEADTDNLLAAASGASRMTARETA